MLRSGIAPLSHRSGTDGNPNLPVTAGDSLWDCNQGTLRVKRRDAIHLTICRQNGIKESCSVIYVKLILTAVFWGGTFIAGKTIAHTVLPLDAAFLRFAIASVFLVVFTRKLEGRLPVIRPAQILPIVLLGLTGVFAYNLLFFTGLHYINAGKASLIVATNPIFISLLSALLFREKLNPIKGFGILMSVTGALIVISNGHLSLLFGNEFGRGELLISGCVASWCAYSLIGKTVMGKLSPVASVCYSSIAGTFLLAIPMAVRGSLPSFGAYSPADWISLFYLGFFGTVLGFFWYYQGINVIGPMKASVFINVVPVSAICLSYFLLDETITPALFAGGLLVVTGVYCTNASEIIRAWWGKLRGRPNPAR